VVGGAAQLRVDQEPAQSLSVIGREVEAFEGNGKAAPQVIDPHQPRAFAHVPRILQKGEPRASGALPGRI
jgi:hypothetical protein